jgi:hypothetical protein
VTSDMGQEMGEWAQKYNAAKRRLLSVGLQTKFLLIFPKRPKSHLSHTPSLFLLLK